MNGADAPANCSLLRLLAFPAGYGAAAIIGLATGGTDFRCALPSLVAGRAGGGPWVTSATVPNWACLARPVTEIVVGRFRQGAKTNHRRNQGDR